MTRLGYDLHGPDGAPVIVLGSSVGTDRRMWQPQLDALAVRHRVLRHDHLGHGTSAVPPGPYGLRDLASAVLELVDELGVDRFSYAGLSLGGMVGMQLAVQVPQRVDRLALLCTSAYLPPARGWHDRAAAVRAGGMAAVAEAVLGRWCTAGFALRRPEVVARLRAMLLDQPPEGYAACCEAIAAMDLRPVLAAVRAPTLVVVGAHDPATPLPHGRLIADGVPGARLEVVAGAHLATVEDADRCTALLLDHLDHLGPPEARTLMGEGGPR